MKRPARRLRLAAETVRVLDLAEVRGGWLAITEECPSAYTYCYKVCSD